MLTRSGCITNVKPRCWRKVSDAKGRSYSTVREVFDRRMKMMQKTRAAMREDVADYEYLKDEVNRRLLDRLEDVYAHEFERVLEIGSGRGPITRSLLEDREDVKTLVQVDSSFKMIQSGRREIKESSRRTFECLKRQKKGKKVFPKQKIVPLPLQETFWYTHCS